MDFHSSELRYFLEVVEQKNISRAAERLGIRQPSLSEAIRRLEAQLGHPLLIRTKKGVVLTKAGERFTEFARNLLSQSSRLSSELAKQELELSGSYSIGCHPSVGLYTLNHFIPRLLDEYAKIKFQFHFDLSRRITEQVVSSKTDIGVVVNPVRHPELVIIPLFQDEVSFWSLNGKEYSTLICDAELLQTQSLLKNKKALGEIDRIISCPNLEIITLLTSSAHAMGIIPERVLNNPFFNTAKNIKQVKSFPSFQDQIALIYRRDSLESPSLKNLIKQIKTLLSSS